MLVLAEEKEIQKYWIKKKTKSDVRIYRGIGSSISSDQIENFRYSLWLTM